MQLTCNFSSGSHRYQGLPFLKRLHLLLGPCMLQARNARELIILGTMADQRRMRFGRFSVPASLPLSRSVLSHVLQSVRVPWGTEPTQQRTNNTPFIGYPPFSALLSHTWTSEITSQMSLHTSNTLCQVWFEEAPNYFLSPPPFFTSSLVVKIMSFCIK